MIIYTVYIYIQYIYIYTSSPEMMNSWGSGFSTDQVFLVIFFRSTLDDSKLIIDDSTASRYFGTLDCFQTLDIDHWKDCGLFDDFFAEFWPPKCWQNMEKHVGQTSAQLHRNALPTGSGLTFASRELSPNSIPRKAWWLV